MEKKDNLRGFSCHGAQLHSRRGNQAVGNCPFCQKEDHFYVNIENRLWDCKRCGLKGNYNTFLDKVSTLNISSFKDGAVKDLCVDRKLPRSAFEGWHVGWNGKEYTIPVRNAKGFLEDVRRFRLGEKTLSTPDANLGLLGADKLALNTDYDVYICEGEWDTFALDWLVRKLEKKVAVVGVPGASVFKREWVPWFVGRRVYLMHDNDGAGEQGKKLCYERLNGVARELHQVVWTPSLPQGFDVRDLIVEEAINQKRPRAAWDKLHKLLQVVQTPATGNIPPSQGASEPPKTPKAGPVSDKEVAAAYRKWLHLPSEECLQVMFGTIYANRIQGDPLWVFMIAPPGGSKSELLMSLSQNKMVESTTSLTPHTLVSGAHSMNGSDPSLLPKLNGRILVIKDFTTILTMHYSSRDEIFGVLRDVYDGKTEKSFGTGVKRSYTSHFGILAGVTPKIEEFGVMHQSLGERFLKYRLQSGNQELSEADKIRRALKNINHETQMRAELCAIANRVIDQEMPTSLPEIPDQIFEYIINLAQTCAMMRGVVDRDRFTQHVMYKPSIEVGTRLAKQLAKLAIGISLYLKKKKVDMEIYYIIRKVALDTAPDRVEEIVRQIWKGTEADKPLTTAEVSAHTRLPVATCFRVLQDLELLKIVNRVGVGNKYEWKLGEKLLTLLKDGLVFVR